MFGADLAPPARRVAWVLNPGGTKTASSLDKQGETLQEEEKRVNAQSNNPFAMLEDLVEESPPSASDWMPKQQKRQGIRNLVADSLSRGTKSQQCSARERHARMDMDSTAPDTEDTMRRKAQVNPARSLDAALFLSRSASVRARR